MDTLEFLTTILPLEGTHYLALIEKGTGKTVHKPFTDLAVMAKAVAKFDADERFSLYHACASYQNAIVEVDGKKKFRVPENWNRAKSFWIDLDCGEDKAAKGSGYLTKKEAVTAVATFCKSSNFPMPMFVDSGNGVHCYWVLTKAIKHEAWRKVAFAFKAVLAHHGVKADPTCTADFSRILRPVGSTNRKITNKAVRVLIEASPMEPGTFAEGVKRLAAELPSLPQEPKSVNSDLNNDLTGHLPPQVPSYADYVANRCAQVAKMRDTKGDVEYEHWRGVIGIIKYCEDPVSLAHEWSERRLETGHSQNDVDLRYNTWNSGPTTCEFFAKCNPSGCDGCPEKGKIKTPLVLGRVEPEPEVEVVEAVVDGTTIEVEIPEFPKGYGHEGDVMVRYMKNADDIVVAYSFATNLFYPTYRIRKESGEYSLQMRMHLPNGRTREFEIDTSLLASNQKLIEGLARYELIPTNNKDASMHLTAYVRDSLEKLKRESEELNTMTSFGWKGEFDAFLLGDRLYHSDGTVRKVLVGGQARSSLGAFPSPRGNTQGYADALNYVYNRPGQEYMQYTLASIFGSILTPLSSNSLYHGLLFALYGEDTGKGKSTVNYAGLLLYGNPKELLINGEKGATINALNATFSTFQNIPVFLDEFTNVDSEYLSQLAYSCTNGADKKRLTVSKGSGVQFADSGSWAAPQHITGNASMQGRLGDAGGNSAAEAVRIIQINVDHYKRSGLTGEDVMAAIKRMELHTGAAGDEYLRYVVTHREEILQIMAKWAARVNKDVPDPKYRFYCAHAECSLAGLEITNRLGITQFDLEAVYQFAVNLFGQLATNVTQQNSLTSEDALSSMISGLSPRILVTMEYRDGRSEKGPESPKRINGAAAGRYIMGYFGDKSPLVGKLFISKYEAVKWCKDNRVDLESVLRYAQSTDVLVPYKEKFTIGRGTDIKTGNVGCYCFDMAKLESLTNMDSFGGSGNVKNLYDAPSKKEDAPLASTRAPEVISSH